MTVYEVTLWYHWEAVIEIPSCDTLKNGLVMLPVHWSRYKIEMDTCSAEYVVVQVRVFQDLTVGTFSST